MGAVTFSIDTKLIGILRASLPLNVFLETGTFRGDTLSLVHGMFDEIYSIELSEDLYRNVKALFSNHQHIHLFLGDSSSILRTLQPNLDKHSVLYFLDAHWCIDENSAGISSQCPLLDEIKALVQINSSSVLIIDDARLFLAPPHPPHAIADWPTLSDVLREIFRVAPSHRLMVLNDTFVLYPLVCDEGMVKYARESGTDWLEVMSKIRDYDNLRNQFNGLLLQLDEKEDALLKMSSAYESRDNVVNGSSVSAIKGEADEVSLEETTGLYENLLSDNIRIIDNQPRHSIEILHVDNTADLVIHSYGNNISDEISDNELKLNSSSHDDESELIKKEIVIEELRAALNAYRSAFLIFRPLIFVFSRTSIYIDGFHFRFKNLFDLFKPKLGRLCHHTPIPLMAPRIKEMQLNVSLPKIALVTPSFRQGQFIERTILSVLDQNYPNLEYVVQDGGSTDSTVEHLKHYADRLSAWRSESDRGQSDAINKGFLGTQGEIMAWLNSDDLLLPGSLHRIGLYFAQNPHVDVVYGNRILIDENDDEIGRWVLPPHDDRVLSWADYVPQETMFWRRDLWERVGGVDEKFSFALDWDLLIRFRDAGANIVRLPYFLGAFRVHQAQKTSAIINTAGQHEMMILRERSLNRKVSWNEISHNILPYLAKHLVHDLLFRVRRRMGASE